MRAHVTRVKTLSNRDLTARCSVDSSEIPYPPRYRQVSLGIWIHLVFLLILLKSRPCFYLKRLCFCKNTFHLKGNIKKKKKAPANAGDARDTGSIPGSGRSPGVGNGNLLQYSCLENSTNRGAKWATVYGVAKESEMTQHTCMHAN